MRHLPFPWSRRSRGAETVEWIAVGVVLAVVALAGYRNLASTVEAQAVRAVDCLGGVDSCGGGGGGAGTQTATDAQPAVGEVAVGASRFEQVRQALGGALSREDPPRTNLDRGKLARFGGPLFVDGASPRDISQGQAADCYLLASMAAIAQVRPGFFEEAVREVGPGRYTVQLWARPLWVDTWQTVRVDNKLPVTLEAWNPATRAYETRGDGTRPVFAALGGTDADGRRELWPAIVERAYARANGGYDAIGKNGLPSRAMQILTGEPSETHPSGALSFEELARYIDEGHAVVGASASPEGDRGAWPPRFRDDTLAHGHAYWVQSVDPKTESVVLRDPFGWSSGNGPDGAIVLTYAQYAEHFTQTSTNPVTRRP